MRSSQPAATLRLRRRRRWRGCPPRGDAPRRSHGLGLTFIIQLLTMSVMQIDPKIVKELRDRTNAGMMDCKRALTEASGDLGKAEVILRTKGIARPISWPRTRIFVHL